MKKQVVKLPLSYFIDNDGNGNSYLSSLTQRVNDASEMLTDSTVIELDNGVRCYSRDELYVAVSQALKNPGSGDQPKSTTNDVPKPHNNQGIIDNTPITRQTHRDINWKKIGIIAAVAVLVLVLFSTFSTPKYDRGREILLGEEYAKQVYYSTHARDEKNPVSFAKQIKNGEYDSQIMSWYPHSRKVPMKEALDKRWVHYGMTYDEIKEVCGGGHEYTLSGRLDHVSYGDSHYGTTTYMLYFERGRLDHVNSF